MKFKKGVSMIGLVITVIVMIILAGVVIVQVQDRNPVDDANEAVFKSNIVTFNAELSKTINDKVLKELGTTREDITATTYDEVKVYIPSLPIEMKDNMIFSIYQGKLKYIGEGESFRKWSKDMGILTN